MSGIIGALRVVLGADTAQLDTGLKGSQDKLAAFGRAAGTAMTLAASAVTAAAAVVGASIKSAIDEADKIGKLSQSAGVTVEEFSKLKYAADLSDVSTEALGKSMGKLSKAMVETAGGGAGPAAQAFAALGISVKNTDGTLRSSSDVISDVAGKFEGYKDGAGKTAIAIALFGKAGADMIPMLNAGKSGLADSADEAQRYGVVLDEKTSKAAEAFNDNLKRMDTINKGMVLQVTGRMLPAFEQMSETMLKAKESGQTLNSIADVITGTLKFLGSTLIVTSDLFRGLATDAVAAFNIMKLGIQWKFGEASEVFKTWQADTATRLGETKSLMSTLWDEVPQFNWTAQLSQITTMNKEVNRLGAEWAKVDAPIIKSGEAQKNALEIYLSSQAKRTAGQRAEAQSVGLSTAAHERLRIALEAEAIVTEKKIPLTDTLRQKIVDTGNAAAAAAMQLQGAQAVQDTMSPAEVFAQKMEQQRLLYAAGEISLETYGKKQQQIAEQAGATWDIAGASIAGSFATISGAFGKESSAMATTAKVFGVIQGTISMFTGAAKALELPFPANIAAVASVLAKGASLVASIKSQAIPTGMMTGGQITVPGSGGPDSVPVNLMMSPGERLDIWRPNEGGGADPRRGGQGGATTVTINMPGEIFTREGMGRMFEQMNDMFADGYRLNLNRS